MPVQQLDVPIETSDIQGNVLAAFNKDHQTFLFFRFGGDGARKWLAELTPDVATTDEVAAFNALFGMVNRRRGSRRRGERGTVEATWVAVAFTAAGLSALAGADAIAAFPEAFRDGMAARAAQIGDVGANDPGGWRFGATGTLHGVVIVAADSGEDMNREVAREHRMFARHGVSVVFEQAGTARTDLPGHEHFGFKDGVSQPGVRGFDDASDDAGDHGKPGQDMVWPGEFVLGYPRQQGAAPPDPTTYPPQPQAVSSEIITASGEAEFPGPEWARNGSYLVVRRLRQDVPAFIAKISELAAAQSGGSTADRIGAKLVGRYESGAPLEPVDGVDTEQEALAGDPSIAHGELLDQDHINNFEYAAADADGHIVPLAAHIRKVYPRDAATIGGGEADTQTHRILRRGIAFGKPYKRGAADDTPHGAADYPHDRGLLFACYQSDIERQFEVIQSKWANLPGFPQDDAGEDPIISQDRDPRPFTLPDGNPDHLQISQFVTTTGGEYFFQPSISALTELAKEPA